MDNFCIALFFIRNALTVLCTFTQHLMMMLMMMMCTCTDKSSNSFT